jgi:hypothetical protein
MAWWLVVVVVDACKVILSSIHPCPHVWCVCTREEISKKGRKSKSVESDTMHERGEEEERQGKDGKHEELCNG